MKYDQNSLCSVASTLPYVAQNHQWLKHIPLRRFPWFLQWLLLSAHQSFKGCSDTHYPSDTHTDKTLECSRVVNAGPTQHHTLYWSVSPEIALSAKLESHPMCVSGGPVLLESVFTSQPHSALYSPGELPFSSLSQYDDVAFKRLPPLPCTCWVWRQSQHKSGRCPKRNELRRWQFCGAYASEPTILSKATKTTETLARDHTPTEVKSSQVFKFVGSTKVFMDCFFF